ncbi:MAG: hypothetical protein DMF56_09710 [Acidobacteria bacterium]|nr:MAG: hypothetical protein DMF56_09710 [Acidobacteriota bacterium]
MANDQQKLAMTQPSTTTPDPFAIAYLQLCEVSYFDFAEIAAGVAALRPLDATGSWQCVWGPAENHDNANLVFVAAYTMAAGLPPTFAAVVTRGTDTDVNDAWGSVENIWEDFDIAHQVPLPWAPDNPARIAGGTVDGLKAIESCAIGGQTLVQFLGSYLSAPANDNPVLVVTGHSLGGCLSSVIAPWLQNVLASQCPNLHVVPATFAGPSAGNAAFASYFDSSFGYSMRYVNSLDIVPNCWASIKDDDDVYAASGIKVPDLIYAAVVGFTDIMKATHVSYAQPATGFIPLTGVPSGSTNWYSEAGYQHPAVNYMRLLGGTSVSAPPAPETAAAKHPTPKSRLRSRLGSIESFVKEKI